MQIFVLGEKTHIYNVEPWRSNYHLRSMIYEREGYPIDHFTLSCNGKPLYDDRCLDQQGVNDNSNVYIHHTGKGGINKWTVIFWLALIVYTLTLLLLIGTGVFNMIAYLYAFLFKWATNYLLHWIFNLSFIKGKGITACIKMPIYWLITLINFIIKHTIVFLFIYIGITSLGYPLFGIRFQDHCQSLFLSKKLGVISAIIYIFIYGLLNLPNLMFNSAQLITDISPVTETIFKPGLIIQENAVDKIKYVGFYAIPFIGQGIALLHNVITQIVNGVYTADEKFKGIDCENAQQVVAQLERIHKCIIEPGDVNESCRGEYANLIQMIKAKKMGNIIEYAIMGLDKTQYQAIKTKYESAGFFTKIDIFGFTKISNEYFSAKASRWILCSILSTVNQTDNFFAYIGTADMIIDTMKMGNIAGMGATVGFIILFIIAMIWPGFLGYL